ncbi:vitamin B12 transporter BtuB [Vitreoscilla sp. C1]|uniref:TonB-dependent receptor domain-containing protein n=1 Tax=Vitreoscilla sp. (strain C1) TaxID=96942 RepID=UPI00148EB62F|nr:TonB-dependent receptor [Vitreoscilla sp. C1]QJQ52347.1 vitamin B12 transporter BtuB [Vitreoscilla sp. C1]
MQTKTLAASLLLLSAAPLALANDSHNDTALEEVVITATRISQNPLKSLNDVSIITRADIEKSNAQFLPELLQQSIGLETVSNGGVGSVGSLFTRGTNTNQTIILIDGVRLVSATTGTASYNHIPLNQIERIEVVRGASSSVYGADAIGGVVQIFTRKAENQPFGGDIGVKIGTEGQRGIDANLSGNTHGVSYQLSAGTERTDGGISATNTDYPFGHHPDEDGYQNQNVSGRLAYEWAEGQELSMRALRYKGEAQYDGGGSDPITWAPIARDDENYITHLTQFSIASKNRINEQLESNLQFSTSRDEGKSVTQGSTDYFIKSKDTRAQWTLSGQHEHIQWQTGAEWLKQNIDSDTDYVVDSRKNWAFFGAMNADYNRFLIESSLRQDRDSQYGLHTTGRLALGYQLTDALVGRISYGTAFRVPTFNELYYPYGGGNPLLKPEKSRSWEAGLKYHQSDFSVDWTVFQTQLEEMINGWPAQNINEATLVGTSLAASKQWQHFKLYSNVTYQDPRDDSNDKLLIQRARVFGNIGIDYQPHEKWSINTHLHVHGRSFADAANTTSLGGYGLLGMSVAYKPNQQWQLRLSGSNLLDKQYTTVRGYHTQGRSVVASGRYQF